MRIGFTGTRSGMSEHQASVVRRYLELAAPSNGFNHATAIHGGCVGADMDFHAIAMELGYDVVVMPGHSAKNPDDLSMRGDFRPGGRVIVEASRTHFARNREIVDSSFMLLACPYNDIQRGGIWYTINYARKQGRPEREVRVIPREAT